MATRDPLCPNGPHVDPRFACDICAALHAARVEMLGRVIRSLCYCCNPGHVLDNGRVWGMCGCTRLLRDDSQFTEEEIAAAIRSLLPAPAEVEAGLYDETFSLPRRVVYTGQDGVLENGKVYDVRYWRKGGAEPVVENPGGCSPVGIVGQWTAAEPAEVAS